MRRIKPIRPNSAQNKVIQLSLCADNVIMTSFYAKFYVFSLIERCNVNKTQSLFKKYSNLSDVRNVGIMKGLKKNPVEMFILK